MYFDKYQRLAKATIEFPDTVAINYLLLALGGETGELLNKAKKLMRVGKDLESLDLKGKILLLDELGDILWYVAVLADRLGCKLSAVGEQNLYKLELRQKNNDISTIIREEE